jgi:WD40 repeat protein
MIASGDKTGQVKVWNVSNGKCLRKIENNNNPISAISFGIDPSHILSAYEVIYLYGLKSSKILK